MTLSSRIAGDRSLVFSAGLIDSCGNGICALPMPKKMAYYQALLITGGTCMCHVDLQRIPLSGHTACIIPPGSMLQLTAEDDVTGYVLSFNNDFLCMALDGPGHPLFQEMKARMQQAFSVAAPEECPTLTHLVHEMTMESGSQQPGRIEILCALFKVFIIHIRRHGAARRPGADSHQKMKLFNKFSTAVDQQFKTKRQVAEYASELAVTPRHLTKVVKKVSGFSASYHIQQRTAQEAMRLAMYSDASMKHIAYSLGFEDLSHFSKFFRNVTGQNFSAFKKQPLALCIGQTD